MGSQPVLQYSANWTGTATSYVFSFSILQINQLQMLSLCTRAIREECQRNFTTAGPTIPRLLGLDGWFNKAESRVVELST